jgi:hypothetical protein
MLRKAIGVGLLASPFVGFAAYGISTEGWAATASSFLTGILVALPIASIMAVGFRLAQDHA